MILRLTLTFALPLVRIFLTPKLNLVFNFKLKRELYRTEFASFIPFAAPIRGVFRYFSCRRTEINENNRNTENNSNTGNRA